MKWEKMPITKATEEKNDELTANHSNGKTEENYEPSLQNWGFDLNKHSQRSNSKITGNIIDVEQFKKGNFTFEDTLNYVSQLKIDEKELIKDAIDESGNIKNGSELFVNEFYKKLDHELGEKQVQIFNNFDLFSWKENDMQHNIVKLMKDHTFEKDIENIICIKIINDIKLDLAHESELNQGRFDNEIKNFLIFRYKDEKTSIIEKKYIKNIIYDYILNNEEHEWKDKKYKEMDLKYLENEIGLKSNFERFQNKNLNNLKINFTKEQINTLVGANNSYKKMSKKDYIVSQISPDMIGVYSRDGVLIGWEKNSNITEVSKTKISDIFDLKKEYLSINSIENLALFKISSSLWFRDYLEKEIKFDMSKLHLENQFYFLNFIQGKTENELSRFKEFIGKSENEEEKINKLKTFLSVEDRGNEIVEKILNIGEKLPEEIAKKIFAKYGEIINTVNNTEEEIKKIFGDKDIPERVLNSVKETLLKRGAKMLSGLGDKVLDPKFEVNEIEILKELDEIKEETIILGQSYVGLYKEGIKVPIEEVTTIKETSTKDLTNERKEELVKIYEKGRPKVTYDKQSHLEFLKEEFKNELNDKDISVVETCFKEETIIIALVDKKDEDSLYIGGLTFVEDVKNAVVAEASMSYVLKKFQDKNIKALVDSRNPLLNMYLKRFGFRITKRLDSPQEIKDNGGEIYYEVEKTKDFRIGEKVEEKEELLEEAA